MEVHNKGSDFLVSHLVAHLDGSPLYQKMQTDWSTLAKALNVHDSLITKMRHDILLNKASAGNVVMDILVDWQSRRGKDANVVSLIKIMEERCNWMNIGAQLNQSVTWRTKYEITMDSKWKDLETSLQLDLLSKNVMFLGMTLPFENITRNIKETELQKIMHDTLKGKVLYDLWYSTSVTLAKSTIPLQMSGYTQRKLVLENMVDPNNFVQSQTDIFVFTGSQYDTFFLPSGPQKLTLSSSQLGKITARFILLESEDHFAQLCKLGSNPTHLLKCIRGNFILVKTFGNDDIGKKNLVTLQKSIDQEKFVDAHLSNHYPDLHIITGIPGMGKSTLLAKTAQQIQLRYQDRLVLFVDFHDLLEYGNDLSVVSPDVAIKAVASYAANNELGKRLLKHMLSSDSYKLELFLDGMEETTSENRKIAKAIISCIQENFKNIRLFITADMSLCRELEQHVGSLSWTIEEVTEKHHLRFIPEKFKELLTSQIIDLKDKLFSRREKIIDTSVIGVPLKCSILGELYSLHIKDDFYKNMPQISQHNWTTTQIYQALMHKKFHNYPQEVEKHVQMALKLLFPGFFESLRPVSASLDGDDNLCSFGILKRKQEETQIKFVHRTFAEYLVADYFAKVSSENTVSQSQNHTLLTNLILETQQNQNGVKFFALPSLASMLNAIIIDRNLLSENNLASSHLYSLIKKNDLQDILIACLGGKHCALFCLIAKLALMSGQVYELSSCAVSNEDIFRILYVASQQIQPILVTQIYEKLLKVETKSLMTLQLKVSDPIGIQFTPIHLAAKVGNYALFKYLLEIFKGNYQLPPFIIHAVIYNSFEDNEQIVDAKIQIIYLLLLETQNNVLNEASEHLPNPHLMEGAHVALLNFLMDNGANVFATDKNLENVAHKVAKCKSPEEFHCLVEKVVSMKAGDIFQKRNKQNYYPIQLALQKMKLFPETLQLLIGEKLLNIPFESVDENSIGNLFIKHEYSSQLLDAAFKNSKPYDCKDGYTTLFHVAAYWQNIEAVDYFIKQGINRNIRDKNGMTALHVACADEACRPRSTNIKLRVLKCLVENGADLNVRDNNGRKPLSHIIGRM